MENVVLAADLNEPPSLRASSHHVSSPLKGSDVGDARDAGDVGCGGRWLTCTNNE